MAEALGIIVNRNPDPKAADIYALVLNNTVVNTIIASYNDIILLSRSYDYTIDITMNGDPTAGIGCTYNAGLDTFIHPPAPPINWVENVRTEFNDLISNLQQMVIDSGVNGGKLSPIDISAAYNSALNDNPGLDNQTLALVEAIHQYILAGG